MAVSKSPVISPQESEHGQSLTLGMVTIQPLAYIVPAFFPGARFPAQSDSSFPSSGIKAASGRVVVNRYDARVPLVDASPSGLNRGIVTSAIKLQYGWKLADSTHPDGLRQTGGLFRSRRTRSPLSEGGDGSDISWRHVVGKCRHKHPPPTSRYAGICIPKISPCPMRKQTLSLTGSNCEGTEIKEANEVVSIPFPQTDDAIPYFISSSGLSQIGSIGSGEMGPISRER